MEKFEDALEILEELLEEEEEKSSEEEESWLFQDACRLEKEVCNLRGVVEKLLPEEVKDWIAQVEQSDSYEEVPLPVFLEEVWNSNWENSLISFAPTRRFEGEIIEGVKIWVELSYSTLVVKVNGAFLFGIALDTRR